PRVAIESLQRRDDAWLGRTDDRLVDRREERGEHQTGHRTNQLWLREAHEAGGDVNGFFDRGHSDERTTPDRFRKSITELAFVSAPPRRGRRDNHPAGVVLPLQSLGRSMADVSIIVADSSRMAAIRDGVKLPGRCMHFNSGSLASAMESIRAYRPKIV